MTTEELADYYHKGFTAGVQALAEEVKHAPKYDIEEGIDTPIGKRLYEVQDNLRARLDEDIDAAVEKLTGEK